MTRTIEPQLTLLPTRERILARADPGGPIEVSLSEAIGLVLAESVIADVDQPPFDRASHDGYACNADEASVGTLLRVVTPRRPGSTGDPTLEAGEAARVQAGDQIPPGADTVIRPSHVRPDPDTGPVRVIEILREPEPYRDVTRRGSHLTSGAVVAAAGTRIKPALIPLLAAQGCVHPLCHRRVRVSVVMVGDQWVRPDEAPTMNRERNAANSALVALTLGAGAMPHDFQAVSGPALRPTLERATTNPVVVILGGPTRDLTRACQAIGLTPLVTQAAVEGIGRVRYGVIQDDDDQVINHVFHLAADPVAASVGFELFVRPLIARLQGETTAPTTHAYPLADGGPEPATSRRTRVRPATLRTGPDGRLAAEPGAGPLDDLTAWAGADGLLVFPERSGPWNPGDLIEFVPFGSAS